jgi:hypothetical protein
MNETPNVIFLIEGGKPLDLVLAHIAERQRVRGEVAAMFEELGAKQAWTDRTNGRLLAVEFRGAPPDGWTKPDRKGKSTPTKGTAWAARLKAQRGYPNPVNVIAEAFGVPLVLETKTEKSHGWTRIGSPLTECGFLYLSVAGPYGMWMPDVPAAIAKAEAEGCEVMEPAKSFRMEFDGCRRLEPEEWDILVAQHKLAAKQAAAEVSA